MQELSSPETAQESLPSDLQSSAPTFDALPLSSETRRALDEMGFVSPTPVQLAVWEPATRGRDAVVQARTGTGKTASFGLPIIDHIVKRNEEGVQALILTPTRELAVQICQELERIAKYRETKLTTVYGGASMEKQIAAIRDGAQVIAGTPGRVLDHIRRGTLRTATIRLLVLDEADEMLSMGFEKELTAILETLPKTRQTLLFSATVPPDIERIARTRLREPEFVTLSGDHVGALSIQHFTYLVPSDKKGNLVRILEVENPESAVIFCNTKDETEAVAGALQSRGYDADWLNGDLPQSDRERVMASTKQGKLRFLVATDVAARGIDISHLTHVINYDLPLDAESYVHRTGRTGRAGRTGTAISLITPQDIGALYLLRLTYKIRPVERTLPSASELKTRQEADVIAMLAEAFLSKGVHEDDRALARRLLTHDQVEGILAGLLREYLGVRPTVREDASQARRQVKRASLRQRSEAPPKAEVAASPAPAATASAAPTASAPVAPSPAAAPAPAAPAPGEPVRFDRPREPRRDRGPREDRPRDDRPRDDRPRDDRPRDDRPRDDRPREERPRDDRPREDRRERRDRPPREDRRDKPQRPADFVSWEPPVEAGDDEPLVPTRPERERTERPAQGGGDLPRLADDAPYAELFIGVGRRDGARAQDLLQLLTERAGVEKDHIRRIRVRDRHAFVAIRKDDAERAIVALHGQSLVGRDRVTVELARDRPPADGAGGDADADGSAGGAEGRGAAQGGRLESGTGKLESEA